MSAKLGSNLRSAMQQAKREALNQAGDADSTTISLEQITLPSSQPRKYFGSIATEALKRSIAEKGILQPLLVRPVGEDKFELVAGERRFRAATELGLVRVPVIVRELNDVAAAEAALTENLQREDLNPVEETEGVLQLLGIRMDMSLGEVVSLLYNLQNAAKGKITPNVMGNAQETVESTLGAVGKMSWQSFVTNRLPLLKLPEDILQALREGRLPYTKALILARIKSETERQALMQRTLNEDLSVADLRRQLNHLQSPDASQRNTLGVRGQKLSRLLKRSSSLEDKSVRKKVESLLDQLEALLEKTL